MLASRLTLRLSQELLHNSVMGNPAVEGSFSIMPLAPSLLR
jgi:hypothetical protein